MEDTLRVKWTWNESYLYGCLNPCFNGRYSQRQDHTNVLSTNIVLILVLMEDTLRAIKVMYLFIMTKSLNPCFNGRYSQSYVSISLSLDKPGLNPCFNGRYSQRVNVVPQENYVRGLNPCFNGRYSQSSGRRSKNLIRLS